MTDEIKAGRMEASAAYWKSRAEIAVDRQIQLESDLRDTEAANELLRAEVAHMRDLLLGAWADSFKLVADAAIVSAEVRHPPEQVAASISAHVESACATIARTEARLGKAVEVLKVHGFDGDYCLECGEYINTTDHHSDCALAAAINDKEPA